ncbi:MAG: LacI family DNA-binding transcriptional regulator [Gaiellaceae bacterium]
MPTIRDVAAEVGVSVTTVSHALSGKRPVNGLLRRRIRETADRLGYRPNRIAVAMSTGKTRTLGMVVPDIANPFFGELLASVERVAGERGYTVISCSSELDSERETRDVRALLDRRVDGLIYLASSAGVNLALAEVEEARVPIVALDEELATLPDAALAVTVDNVRGGALAAEHLLELGHEEMAVCGGPRGLPTAAARLAGFVEKLEQAGRSPARGRVVHADAYRISSGRKAGIELLAGDEALTAIFCANDLIALGVIEAARSLGRDVPGGLSVVGFDDSFVASVVSPPLTTIRQPLARLGKEAANLAIDLIEDPAGRHAGLQLPVELVVRGSTSRPLQRVGVGARNGTQRRVQ